MWVAIFVFFAVRETEKYFVETFSQIHTFSKDIYIFKPGQNSVTEKRKHERDVGTTLMEGEAL
jgi:hypothetical protein